MSVTPARGRQLSLFGVEAHPPAPLDLEGLLAGAGQVGRMGGTGRVSIVVEGAWRCAVLRAEFELRGLAMTCEPTAEDDRWLVRTAYSAALAPLAARWLDEEGVKRLPSGLVMEGRRLRLWVAAAGAWDGQRAYLLRLALRSLPAPESENDNDGETIENPDAPGPTAGSDVSAAEADPVVATSVDVVNITADDVRVVAPRPLAAPRERPFREARARPVDPEKSTRPRGRKGESKITAFDPGRDEFADVDADVFGIDEFAGAEEFVDDAPDEWPDSGIGDLPTVALDRIAEPFERAEGRMPDEGGIGGTDETAAAIDRQVVDNWVAVGDALIAVGLPVVFIAPDAGGPAYRIVGLRRITRLAELVGEPPPGAPPDEWPR